MVPARLVEWEASPFPKNSDWPGPRGQQARIASDEITLQGRPACTTKSFTAPLTVECEFALEQVKGHDGGFTLVFVQEDNRRDMDLEHYVGVAFGYSNPDGSGARLEIQQDRKTVRVLTSNPMTVKAGESFRLRVELGSDALRVSLNGNAFEPEPVKPPGEKFYVRLVGWQPVNRWKVRKLTVR